MTTKKPDDNTPDLDSKAESAEGEDPMTSFEPESGAAAGGPPAQPEPQGNGSDQTLRRPGSAGGPAGRDPGAGAAQSAQGTAQPASGPDAAPDAAPAAGEGAGEAGAAEGAAEPDPLELARLETAAVEERLLRLQAEFENYKKRIHKEHADALRFALTPLVTEVAAIMDNLERAVEHVRKDPGEGVAPLLEGVEMVVRQMQEALGRFGVTRIEAVGKPFDPALHEAINVVETEEVPENQVLEEYQAGYLLHDRVVRPSRVCVSKRASAQQAEPTPAEQRS